MLSLVRVFIILNDNGSFVVNAASSQQTKSILLCRVLAPLFKSPNLLICYMGPRTEQRVEASPVVIE